MYAECTKTMTKERATRNDETMKSRRRRLLMQTKDNLEVTIQWRKNGVRTNTTQDKDSFFFGEWEFFQGLKCKHIYLYIDHTMYAECTKTTTKETERKPDKLKSSKEWWKNEKPMPKASDQNTSKILHDRSSQISHLAVKQGLLRVWITWLYNTSKQFTVRGRVAEITQSYLPT